MSKLSVLIRRECGLLKKRESEKPDLKGRRRKKRDGGAKRGEILAGRRIIQLD